MSLCLFSQTKGFLEIECLIFWALRTTIQSVVEPHCFSVIVLIQYDNRSHLAQEKSTMQVHREFTKSEVAARLETIDEEMLERNKQFRKFAIMPPYEPKFEYEREEVKRVKL